MKEQPYPLISIVTVSYNAVSTIEETILSVINQTYPNIEYIIIDGGSIDGTIDIIKKYENRIFYWISEPDKGIYDAMNKGIDVATGEWINFMNSGDSFYDLNVIKKIIGKFIPNIDIIYGDTNLLFSIGNFMKKADLISDKDKMPFSHQAAFVKTNLLKQLKFDITYNYCADRDFFTRAFNRNAKFEYIPAIICNYEAESGCSAINPTQIKYEIGKIENKTHSIVWRISYIFFCVNIFIRSFLKKILPPKLVDIIRRYNIKCLIRSKNK